MAHVLKLLNVFVIVTWIKKEMIPLRPSIGCPKGTFDGATTCYCEDHCSWEACRLLNPPPLCLSSMKRDGVWAWDSASNFWVAQGSYHKNTFYLVLYKLNACHQISHISCFLISDTALCTNGFIIESDDVAKQYEPGTLGNYKYHEKFNGRSSFKHVVTNRYLLWSSDNIWMVGTLLKNYQFL